jgi:hypothetical protein
MAMYVKSNKLLYLLCCEGFTLGCSGGRVGLFRLHYSQYAMYAEKQFLKI